MIFTQDAHHEMREHVFGPGSALGEVRGSGGWQDIAQNVRSECQHLGQT
jgi:hypothetical protein